MGLQQYRAKRDFRKTAEPSGVALPKKARDQGGRFVMHKHAATRLHYDLRLEHDGVLWSWAVTRGPSLDPAERRLAVHVEDHPLDYGSFEGNIPKGQYGGGAVVLWDDGTWTPEFDPVKGMKKGHIRFSIEGQKLKGEWHLVRLKPRPGEKRENWLLIKSDDEFADPSRDILEEMPESVKTGRTIEEVAENKPAKKVKKTAAKPSAARAKLPDFIPPCLARIESRPPSGEDWIHEVKFDGYRLQAHVANGKVTLYTRTGLDWTKKFGKPVNDALAALDSAGAVIDGEVVVMQENGVSNFSALQLALSEGRPGDMVFFAFDLLHLNGKALLDRPLSERKEKLRELLRDGGEGHLRYSEHFAVPGQKMLKNACEHGLEGIVSKRTGAPYRSGRGYDWIKSKCTLRQEFVIAGYLPSDKTGRGIRSLIMSYYEDGKLSPAGNVGTGFTAEVLRDLKKKLDPLVRKSPPIGGPLSRQKGAVWVEPELAAEVEFRTWTHDGLIRHASYQGLREDKPAKEVIAETKPGVTRASEPVPAATAAKTSKKSAAKAPRTSVKLSNPTKKLWPDEGVTKKDLLDYYALVWPRMRQFVVDRPLSLVRAPDGVGGQRFFQKHSMPGMPDKIFTSHDPEDNEEILFIKDFDGLAALVQLGVVEVHIWGATVEKIGEPDQIVFDLDPDEGLGVEDVRAAAFEVKEKLDELGFATFLKTSGGKGFHVVTPLKPKADWDEVKGFAQDFARALAQGAPERYTATMSKKSRKGRIFVDYLRNGRGSTTIAPYSSRAKKGATMSMPITWEMLEAGIGPADYRIGENTIAERIPADDPWADFFKKGRALERG